MVYALTKYHQRSQTFVDLEIAGLRRRGIDVHVVAMEHGHVDRSADSAVRYLDTVEDQWGAVVQSHALVVGRHPIRAFRFYRRVVALRSELGTGAEQVPWWRLPTVARDLERRGVSAVHAHFGWSGAAAACFLGALLGVPWSMTLHAKDIFTRRHNLGRKLKYADRVVTVCDYNRRWIVERWPRSAPVSVMTCGVEVPSDGRPAELTADVVAVARLIPKKGLDLLIRAAGRLRDDNRPTHVTIAGDGPMHDELVALVAELGLSDLVTFVGECSHDDALALIASAHVFCLPCRIAADGDRDAMPTVIIEAMMRGVPIVSTLEVGIPEMVDDSCGRLVPTEDVHALADALDELLADAVLARRLGAEGARRAREQYSIERHASRLASLFEGHCR